MSKICEVNSKISEIEFFNVFLIKIKAELQCSSAFYMASNY